MDGDKNDLTMDEAAKDPGVLTTHHSYTDVDFEGNFNFYRFPYV